MTSAEIPKRILAILKKVKNKRAKIVIEHILQHGQVTTEDLERYGYKHPPRAARDVRELGIPLQTFRVSAADGRSIAAYRFGDLTQVRTGKLAQVTQFEKFRPGFRPGIPRGGHVARGGRRKVDVVTTYPID